MNSQIISDQVERNGLRRREHATTPDGAFTSNTVNRKLTSDVSKIEVIVDLHKSSSHRVVRKIGFTRA